MKRTKELRCRLIFQDEVLEALRKAAFDNHRSLTKEIVHRLEQSVKAERIAQDSKEEGLIES